MPPPTSLSAAHLVHAVVPAALPGDTEADPVPVLTAGVDRVDALLRITDAWRVRLPQLPDPPERVTLGDVVQAARRRLRGERLRVDEAELSARRFVLDRVRTDLLP
jgi:hypothetical protein